MGIIYRTFKNVTIVMIVVFIIIIGVSLMIFLPVKANENTRPVIIVDAGHGGFDGGAVADDGTLEKDINLKISLYTEEILKLNGYNVIMSRKEDNGTENKQSNEIASKKRSDLKNRLSLMKNNPDAIFVSIHLNKFTTSAASGAQVFYSASSFEIQSKNLADSIQKSFSSQLQPNNKRVIKKGNSNAFLLKYAPIPAVIVECGFLSNAKDLNALKSESYQKQVAFCISNGIIEYQKNKDENNGKS